MKRKHVIFGVVSILISVICFAGCGNSEKLVKTSELDKYSSTATNSQMYDSTLGKGQLDALTYHTVDLICDIYSQSGIGMVYKSVPEENTVACTDDKIGIVYIFSGTGESMFTNIQIMKLKKYWSDDGEIYPMITNEDGKYKYYAYSDATKEKQELQSLGQVTQLVNKMISEEN